MCGASRCWAWFFPSGLERGRRGDSFRVLFRIGESENTFRVFSSKISVRTGWFMQWGFFKNSLQLAPRYLILDSRILKTRVPIVVIVPGWNPCLYVATFQHLLDVTHDRGAVRPSGLQKSPVQPAEVSTRSFTGSSSVCVSSPPKLPLSV